MTDPDNRAAFVAESLALVTRLYPAPWTPDTARIIEESATPILDPEHLSWWSRLSGEPLDVFWHSPTMADREVWRACADIEAKLTASIGAAPRIENSDVGRIATWDSGPHATVRMYVHRERSSPAPIPASIHFELTPTELGDVTHQPSTTAQPDLDRFASESAALAAVIACAPTPDLAAVAAAAVSPIIDADTIRLWTSATGHSIGVSWSTLSNDGAQAGQCVRSLVGRLSEVLDTTFDIYDSGRTISAHTGGPPHASIHISADMHDAKPPLRPASITVTLIRGRPSTDDNPSTRS